MDDAAPKPRVIARSSHGEPIKIVATVLVIGGAIVLLLTASISKGAEYYKHVDEVTTSVDAFRGKKLQVHGHVVDGSIEQAKGTLMYRFKIESRPDRPRRRRSPPPTRAWSPTPSRAAPRSSAKGSLTAGQPGGRHPRRHHGEVPVQVRRRQAAGGASSRRRHAEALSRSVAARERVRCSAGRRPRAGGWRAATDTASPATR